MLGHSGQILFLPTLLHVYIHSALGTTGTFCLLNTVGTVLTCLGTFTVLYRYSYLLHSLSLYIDRIIRVYVTVSSLNYEMYDGVSDLLESVPY